MVPLGYERITQNSGLNWLATDRRDVSGTEGLYLRQTRNGVTNMLYLGTFDQVRGEPGDGDNNLYDSSGEKRGTIDDINNNLFIGKPITGGSIKRKYHSTFRKRPKRLTNRKRTRRAKTSRARKNNKNKENNKQ